MEQIETIISNYLKSLGVLTPETDEEINNLIKEIKANNIELPKELDDPLSILKKGYNRSKISPEVGTNEIIQQFAMAARKLNSIPQETLNKMHLDRDTAKTKETKD